MDCLYTALLQSIMDCLYTALLQSIAPQNILQHINFHTVMAVASIQNANLLNFSILTLNRQSGKWLGLGLGGGIEHTAFCVVGDQPYLLSYSCHHLAYRINNYYQK